MEENKKYYTPEISEFHVGFECEIEGEYDELDNFEWKKEIITCVTNITEELLKRHIYRVKFLDAEDIVSLGWWKDVVRFRFSSPNYNYEFVLHFTEGESLLRIDKFKGEIETAKHVFIGLIKNKSELNKIMKQLNAI